MNCRRRDPVKMCPAYRSLRIALAAGMYDDGVPIAVIAARLEFRSKSAISHIVKRTGMRQRRPQ